MTSTKEQTSKTSLPKQILKTLYAPHKAFKEIIQNPRYWGPLLIMVLLVVANVGYTYVATSKTYVEQTLPSGQPLDEWTENATLWTSNAVRSQSSDNINGTYYGNSSIAFTIMNGTEVAAELDNIGPINCTGPDGFSLLSFRLKWTNPTTNPDNLTVQLFSSASSNHFDYAPTIGSLNLTYNIWNNLTIPLNTQLNWSSSGNAVWANITGLKLDFMWNGSSNITLLVDGLFFHGPFKSLYESAGTLYMANFAIVAFMQFVFTWVLLTGIAYILTKAFGAKLVWKPFLVLIGFALITMFVQVIVNTAAYTTLGNIRYPFDLIGGVQGEGQVASDAIQSQTVIVSNVLRVMQLIVYAWTIALSAIAVRIVAEISWFKSAVVATIAYFVALLAESFIIG